MTLSEIKCRTITITEQLQLQLNYATMHGKAMLNACCGLSVIFCGFIWLLIGHEIINIQKIFSQTSVHGFIGKTVIGHAKWHSYLKTKS